MKKCHYRCGKEAVLRLRTRSGFLLTGAICKECAEENWTGEHDTVTFVYLEKKEESARESLMF